MHVQVIGSTLPYAHRKLAVGEHVDMPRSHAEIFLALGRVRLADPVFDIPAAPPPLCLVSEAEISPRTGKPKRAYRRRDLRAEE